MHHRRCKDALPTLLVLREHDSVWAPQALGTVLASMDAIHSELGQSGYEVVPLQIKSPCDLPFVLFPFDPRACLVFNCYEGVEEGAHDAVQVVEGLETLGFAYTGAGAQALCNTQNKAHSKQLLQAHGIPTPRWQMVDTRGPAWTLFPAIVKMANDHGSENLTCESVVYDERGLERQVQALEAKGVRCLMIAEFIEGREFTVAMWGNGHVGFLPLLEVDYTTCPAGQPRLRTYAAKWDTGATEIPGSHLIRPTDLGAETERLIEQVAYDAFCALGLRDYARIDLRLKGEEPQVIDVNTNPDITTDGSFAIAADQGGYTYSAMLDRIARLAWARREQTRGERSDAGRMLPTGASPAR